MGELLRVRLLGDPEVRDGTGVIDAFASPRLQSLLGFLVLHRNVAIARRRLAFLFWPDSSEPQARTNLRQALHHLRYALDEPERFLRLDGRAVQWRADAPAHIDVVEFDRAVAEAAGTYGDEALERAASLYGGELLAGCYDDWVVTVTLRCK